MNEPLRLRDGQGPARALMAGSVLHVPNAARRRAIELTSAAATLSAGATAVAATTTSLVKSFVLCVCVGAAGGGVMSLAASETISRLQAPASSTVQPTPKRQPRTAAGTPPPKSELVANEPRATEAPEAAEPSVAEPAAKDAKSRAKPSARDDASADVTPPADPSRHGSSLFEEQRIIESARAAMARGDAHGALSLLDNYERSFQTRQFGPEALALRIEALRGSGQLGAARALAADFAQKYPHHPLLARVRSLVSTSAP